MTEKKLKIYSPAYFDGTKPWAERASDHAHAGDLDNLLRSAGYGVLGLTSKHLGFDPSNASPSDFISVCDVAVTLAGHSYMGFPSEIEQLLRQLERPGYVFVFKDDLVAMQRFLPFPSQSRWPFLQYIAIANVQDVLGHLNPADIRVALRALTRTVEIRSRYDVPAVAA